MQQRPRILLSLSVALVAVAIAMPVQVMFLYGHTLNEMGAIAAKLTIFNWLVIAGCLTAAYLVAGASSFSRRALIALTGVVAVNNYFVGYYALDFSPVMATLGTLAFGTLNYPLYREDVRRLLENPNHRWWVRSERHRLSIPVLVGSQRRTPLKVESFDLSESGIFIPLDDPHLNVNELITLRLSFGVFARLRCEGRVVRASQAKGSYPAGIGIAFTGMDWRAKRELRRHLKEYAV